MKSLRDQLLQAGLVSEKDVRRAEQEARRERKQKGLKRSEQEAQRERQRQERHRQRLDEQRRRQREARKAAQQRERQRQQMFRLRDIVRSGELPGWHGRRRWYFVCEDEVLRYVEVSDRAAVDLESGAAAIAATARLEGGGRPYVVVTAETARRLRSERPALVRFWNRAR